MTVEFKHVQWLFPAAVTVHNLEEFIWLPGFVSAHAAQLPWHVDPGAFRSALFVLTVAAWIITYLSWQSGQQSIWAYLLFGYTVAMVVNVFVPHVPAAIRFWGYSPGVVTAVVVNLPVMTWLLMLALRDKWISGRKTIVFGVSVPVGLAAIILLLFTMANRRRR